MALYNGFEMCSFHSPVLEEYNQLQNELLSGNYTHIFIPNWMTGINRDHYFSDNIVIPFTTRMLHSTTLKCYQEK